MDFKIEQWTKKDYAELTNYLISIKEDTYQKFHSRLTFTKYEILGIRVPLLRKIATEISKGNYQSFLKLTEDKYYEQVFLEAIVISKITYDIEFKYELERFKTKIDNWAICDSFCTSLKIVNHDLDGYFEYFTTYLKSNDPFTIRIALIIYLNYYLKEKYIDQIIDNILKIKNNNYYVKMAIAWLLAESYLSFKAKIIALLKSQKIDIFIQNKAISKITDSFRVAKDEKKDLRKLRRR